MVSSANDTSFLPFFKRQYPKGFAFTGYKKSKMLALMATDKKFGGEGKHYTVSTAPTSGGSADYQKAYSNQGGSKSERFFLQHRTEYQVARIKGSTIAKSMGDLNAIKSAVTEEFDKANYAFGRALAQRVWSNGGGSLGRISSGTSLSGSVITLATITDAVRFEQGAYIQLASDDGTGTSPSGVRGNGQMRQILKIKPSTGELTLDAAINTISGATALDYIFRAGDYGICMTGIPGWAPYTSPTGSDSYFGVNRSNHEFRLSGYRKVGNGGSKEATLLDACAEGQTHGAYGTKCALNPIDFTSIVKEVGSDRMVDIETKVPNLGFRGLELETAIGTIQIMSEVDVPKGFFWIVDPDQYELATAGDCPRLLDFDGLGKMVRVQGEDSYQIDMGAYGNIGCKDPSNSICGSF
jgi:hypothetical protein